MRRPALVILVLAVAASFFGWETYKAWTAVEGPAEAPAKGAAPAASVPAVDNVSREGDLAVQVAVIVTKPLFRPDRQPFLENAAVPAQRNYEAELSRFSLVGVLLQGEERKGLVLSAASGRQDRWEVGSGDSLPGFTVREVETDGLSLSSDGKEFFLHLYAGGPKSQPSGSLRTEVSPGIPGAQAPAASKEASRQPNANVSAAAPSPLPAAAPLSSPAAAPPPSAAVAPPPSFPVFPAIGGRGIPRPLRVYPFNR